MIPYGRQDIQDTDVNAVIEVLKSDFLTQGPAVPKFEQIVTKFCGGNHAVAVNSATSALHIALLALGVEQEDIVWTCPNTFVASSNAALYCGAKVDFIDIDPDTYNMSISELTKKLEIAEVSGALPKVVMPVHFAGQPCDMKSINELSKRYGFKVLEDASHAIGGRYLDNTIGNCKYSDITVFSFHPVKIVTTAEGGMALTNNADLAEKMALLRSHGITRDPFLMKQAPDGPWYYEQIALGFNYRMTDLQAALGASQMHRLQGYIDRRHEIAERYTRELIGLPIILPKQEDFAHSAYHLYVIRLDLEACAPLTHSVVFNELRARSIFTNVHYIPVHTQPYYKNMGFAWGDFPNAEAYYQCAISIPMFPTLTYEAQAFVVASLFDILEK